MSVTGALQVLAGVAILDRARLETFAAGHELVAVLQDRDRAVAAVPGALLVNVNGAAAPGVLPRRRPDGDTNPLYNLTYDSIKNNKLDDVLVIGAGGGNDVSVALAHGAKHVDAVEIDPRLYDLGQVRTTPTSRTRTRGSHAHIDDGRAFLERTDKKYDLIVFALPDSLTLVSGQSVAAARELPLHQGGASRRRVTTSKPDGVFSMYNYYREGWLHRPLRGHARARCSGTSPCVDRSRRRTATSRCSSSVSRARRPRTAGKDGTWKPSGDVAEARDRRPPVPVPDDDQLDPELLLGDDRR